MPFDRSGFRYYMYQSMDPSEIGCPYNYNMASVACFIGPWRNMSQIFSASAIFIIRSNQVLPVNLFIKFFLRIWGWALCKRPSSKLVGTENA